MGGVKMKSDSIKWRDIWKFPLEESGYTDYVHSSNGVLALSHFRTEWIFDDVTISKIVSIINGKINSDFHPEWKAEGCEILYQGVYAFSVRGWGYLTGIGGLNLSIDVAEKVQDEFISYILNKLNGKEIK